MQVGRGDYVLGGIAELPPPLVADHLDLERRSLVGRRLIELSQNPSAGAVIVAALGSGAWLIEQPFDSAPGESATP